MKGLGFFLAVVFILLATSVEAKNLWSGVYSGKVVEVQDGDTVIISPKPGEPLYQCRLYGIDTPEIRKKKRAGQPYSKEATEEMERLALGKKVRVFMTGRQTYGREVCLIRLEENDLNINLEMVKRGYAWAYRQYLQRAYASEYIYAESQAREKKLGIWQDRNPEPPWEFRKRIKKHKIIR